MNKSFWAGLAGGLLCGFLPWLLTTPAERTSEASTDQAAIRDILQRMEGSLASLEVRLGNLEVQPIPVMPAPLPGSREPIPEEGGPVLPVQVPSLARIDRALENLQKEVKEIVSREKESLFQLRQEYPAIAWYEMEALHRESGGQWEKLTEKMKLMSYREILRKYGAPTEVWRSAKSGKIFWGYDRKFGTPKDVEFAFLDGYVVEAYSQ